MILIGYTWSDVLFGILWVSISILILVIIYRKILSYLNGGTANPEDYCELYTLEMEPATGELPFYFTSSKTKAYKFLILDTDLKEVKQIAEQECKVGGNILRFDSSLLSNGTYFYCLKTDNQKIMKKMTVINE